ncbi:TonB-dependent receptor [Acinetobacter baumannii]|uniref:TonB-dependent receptor plug domain-containing protein n=1 Tax=Acinetobacter baumannii TaxID=470 RepID=UPI00244D212F|nr:TonB-dependent receptor [Acinetobacter baumannii]MDH2523583.1 TonB-dependent receptor [Acinetobacter baumannii]MDV7462159.1 TonB-dependent receptor [Acinetobacter baumannii]
MSKSFQPTRLVGAIAIAMGCSPVIFAEDATDATQLDPIVITASKSAEKASEVPARISVISKEEIEKNPALNLSDILQKDASIYVKQSGGVGQLADLSLRGGRTGHTLLLKDGARINSQNGLGPLTPEFMDLTDVDQIEILKGPASVQYGSDAISGAIQLISNTPKKNNAFVTGIYGEDNTYKAIVGADIVSPEGFYAQIRGQRLETDGTSILDIQDDKEKAPYDQKGYSTKIGYDNEAFKTSLAISQNKGINNYTTDSYHNNSQKQFENQLINWLASYNINQNIALNARYSNTKNNQTYLGNPDSHYNAKANEGDINAKWKFTNTQNLLAGIDSNRSEYSAASLIGNKQKINTTGYYIQHQYNNDGIHTQAGVRVEDNDWFGTHTVGQVAARYQIAPLTSIYANMGTAFKAPTLEQLYGSYSQFNFQGNPNLKPEESKAYEVGIDQQLAYGLSVYISAYYTDIKNLISSGKIDNKSTYINLGKARITGGETGLKWKLNEYFSNIEYSYIKSRATDSLTSQSYDVAYRPHQTITFTAGYDDGVYGVNASLIARSKANADNTINSVKVPGYATIDLNAFWNMNPNIKLFTNIQNIGDVRNKQVYNAAYHDPANPQWDSPEYWYISGGRQASVGITFRY